ncbi:MAG: chemotaxis protein CheW [Candidatus Electrothrix sp. YB6]
MGAEQKKPVSAAAKSVKTVSVHLAARRVHGRLPVLLFTAGQVDEILADVEVQPIPFAADHMPGLCAWRNQVLPVIDAVRLFGLQPLSGEGRTRYLVVRTAVPAAEQNSGAEKERKEILRCVLRISDQIGGGNSPPDCIAVSPQSTGIRSVFVRGLFQREDELFIVPDLVSVLRENSGVESFMQAS